MPLGYACVLKSDEQDTLNIVFGETDKLGYITLRQSFTEPKKLYYSL